MNEDGARERNPWAAPDPSPTPDAPRATPDQPGGPWSQPPPQGRGWGAPPAGAPAPAWWGQPGQQPPPGATPPAPPPGQPWGQPAQPAQPWAQPAQPAQPWGHQGHPGQSWAPAPGQQPWGQPSPWGQPNAWGPQPWGQPQPWGWQPYPGAPDPAAKRKARRRAFLALGTVVVLLFALVGGVAFYEHNREQRVREEVAALVPGLQEFVAAERGLPFKNPVDVEVLDDDAFLEALYEEPADAPAEREDRDPEPTLKALGLLEDDADLEAEVTESLDEGVVGFYDPDTERLVVRGREVDAFVEMVIVHELVHALQDQHFELHRPELDEADDERSLAFTSLVEGDATRVETVWYEEQSPSRQQEIDEVIGGSSGGEFGVVEQLLGFPYYAGPAYVEGVLADGGQPALDALFAKPPTTSEQILRPEEPAAVTDVPDPDLDGDVVDAGVLGLLGLHLLDGIDPLGENTIPGGWAGDEYVTTRDGDRTCTLAHIAADRPGELRQYLQAWAASQPDAQVGAGPAGTVRLQACA
ncbi:MAG: DUF6782 family putative metallopeptidase [Actinomycetes bacterium]